MKISEEFYPTDFPPKEYHVVPGSMESALDRLREIVRVDGTETAIDVFLNDNTSLLARCLNFTQFGHHGTWVIPQQVIRPPQTQEVKGLKPDYLIGGKGSDGYRWFVVELKGANEKIFVENNGVVCFSRTVNRGIFQLLNYINYCSSAQAYLRESLRLRGLREPEGILVVGRESELNDDPRKQEMKSAWNRLTSNRIQIRTFDALLRCSSSSYT